MTLSRSLVVTLARSSPVQLFRLSAPLSQNIPRLARSIYQCLRTVSLVVFPIRQSYEWWCGVFSEKKMRVIASRMSAAVVRVCTFNLRHGYVDRGTPNEWEKRRPILKQCLQNIQPSIIGTQEGDPPQLNDILTDLNQ